MDLLVATITLTKLYEVVRSLCSVYIMSVFLTESLVEFLQVAERQACRVAGFTQGEVAYSFFYDVAIAKIHNT